MKDSLYLKMCEYIKESGISEVLEHASAVVVGFSGGADSVLLTLFLKKYLKETKLYACHLNHMIRGAEADRDNDFARGFCEANEIPFTEEKVNVSAIAKNEKNSVEECARNIRYDFFDRCRKKISEDLCTAKDTVIAATAHNADDNLETVIFNLTRGSGTRGLSGISPIRDGWVVRPILSLSSDEIRTYCKVHSIEYVVDSTNESNDYTRNLIRHSISPVLKAINPSVTSSVLGASFLAREDEGYLIDRAHDFLEKNGYEPERKVFIEAGYPIYARVIKLMFERISDADISRVNITDSAKLIFSQKNGSIDFPDKIKLCVGNKVRFVKEENAEINEMTVQPFSFELKNGITECPNGPFSVGLFDSYEKMEDETANIYNSLITISLNNDKIKGTLYVRNRINRDHYRINGHHRKVKKIMNEMKVPVEERDLIPLICDDDGIVWIPGLKPRDGICVDSTGNLILTVGRITD